mgnify:CR=1 FL=1
MKNRLTAAGILIAIGIAFGDIGTSPLYVMKAIASITPSFTPDYILGAVSCVIWTLTLQATLKYVVIALRADNKGEGGILSLFSLIRGKSRRWVYAVAATGAAALIADGMLTPAITVTSAVEGIRLVLPSLPVLPVATAIIILIFLLQQAGTDRIGRLFGPFMLVWFLALGAAGIYGMHGNLWILRAFNPWYAVKLLTTSPEWFMIMGAVFLCVTGAEALYSDLGHCGRRNITAGWIFIKAMLILNYLGQGAFMLSAGYRPGVNPFYAIVPQILVVPAVCLATCAAVIASQALLSGSFTIFSEAVALNFWPRLRIKYPSAERGQLYIPSVNWSLLAGCLLTVVLFRDSSHIEAAYGISITITMLMTTVLLALWMRMKGTPAGVYGLFAVFFLILEGIFFTANLAKFIHGGWYSLLAAASVAAIMMIWNASTRLRNSFISYIPLRDRTELIEAISNDREIPKYASNVVYLSRSDNPDMLESKVLYSIINKQPKRADHYWFIHMEYDDSPDTLTYGVKTFVKGRIFVVTFRIGYRINPRVSVYLRQVVEDLVAKGELDLASSYPSLRAYGIPGDFRFIMLHRIFTSQGECGKKETLLLRAHDRLRRLALSDRDALGLDTSLLDTETVPLILTGNRTGRRVRPEPQPECAEAE